MRKTRKSPSVYLNSLAEEPGRTMRALDNLISGVMTGLSRKVWQGVFWGGTDQTIIGYGDITSPRSRGRTVEWFMIGLALQKNHVSIYVNAVEGGKYLAEKYRMELGKVTVGKASIGLVRLEDINLDALRKVVTLARKQMAQQA